VDIPLPSVDDRAMAAVALSTVGRRVFVGDARDNGGFLRVTWHEDVDQFVVSNWEGNVCVGATRVRLDDAPELIAVLVKGLAEAGTRSPTAPPGPPTLRELARSWWAGRRARLAEVVPLARR
jgi:hypothetical protein